MRNDRYFIRVINVNGFLEVPLNKKTLPSFIILLVLILSGVAWFFLSFIDLNNPIAKIYQNGKLIYSIELDEVFEEYFLTIKADNNGENILVIRNSEIAVESSSCPDKTCVKIGFISNKILPIVCLPNKLEIKIIESRKNTLDAVVR